MHVKKTNKKRLGTVNSPPNQNTLGGRGSVVNIKSDVLLLIKCHLLRIVWHAVGRMSSWKLPRARRLERQGPGGADNRRIDRGPVGDRAEIVPATFLVQRLMMKLLLLLSVHLAPIFKAVDRVARTFVNSLNDRYN